MKSTIQFRNQPYSLQVQSLHVSDLPLGSNMGKNEKPEPHSPGQKDNEFATILHETNFSTERKVFSSVGNKKPDLGGSGLKANDGDKHTPIIAHSEIKANSALLCSEKAMSYSAEPFIKVMRRAEELLVRDEKAFKLIVFIALHAVREKSKFCKHGLEVGEAFIAGPKALGWSEQTYREAKYRVSEKYKFATFRGTGKGTIASLTGIDVCDINLQQQERAEERTRNGQATGSSLLIQEDKKIRSKKQLARAQDFSSFGKFVKLKPDEYEELEKKFGKPELDVMIEKINDHCESTGTTYKGFAATIRNWFRREVKHRVAVAPGIQGKDLLSSATAPAPLTLSEIRSRLGAAYSISESFGQFVIISRQGYEVGRCSLKDSDYINKWLKDKKL